MVGKNEEVQERQEFFHNRRRVRGDGGQLVKGEGNLIKGNMSCAINMPRRRMQTQISFVSGIIAEKYTLG